MEKIRNISGKQRRVDPGFVANALGAEKIEFGRRPVRINKRQACNGRCDKCDKVLC